MAGVLQHLRSSTLDKRPNPASMVDGQVAINYASGSPGMFFKDSNGSLVKVGPVHVGSTAPNVSPASGGTAGNSIGEQWLDNSGGTYVFKIWDGSAWRSEAGEFVNATGDTMTGDLVMDNANLVFEGSVEDGFETTLTVVNPTADRTITLPNVTGTVVTTGDSGTVTSTMIANSTIVNADVNASAAIAGTKISPDFGSQTIQTTGIISAAGGSAAAPSIAFTGDTNTGIYRPGADQVAISTNGTGRLFVDANGQVGIGKSPETSLHVAAVTPIITIEDTSGATAGIESTCLIRNNDAFEVQLRSAANVFKATAYRTEFDSSGISSHQWRIGNSEKARIDSSGRLGLGTSSPVNLLHVQGDATFEVNSGGQFAIRGSTNTSNRFNFGFETTNNYAWLQAVTSGTAFRPIALNPSGGNVGIGTTSPGAKLQISDPSTPALRFQYGNNSGYAQVETTSVNDLILTAAPTNNTGSMQFNVFGNERARIDSSGRLLVGTSSQSGGSLLQVNDNRIRIATAKTPASATDTGVAGEICWDANYVYVCTATNTWKRTAISTW
jgi:hypothetical protein